MLNIDFDFEQSFRKWKIYKLGILTDISEIDSKTFKVFDCLSEIIITPITEYSSSIETYYFNNKNEFICTTQYDTIYIADSLYDKTYSLLSGLSDIFTILKKIIVGYLCDIIYPKELFDAFNGLKYDYYLDTLTDKHIINIKTNLNL